VSVWVVQSIVMSLFLFSLGAVLGSFLNVAIYRLPLRDDFWGALRSVVYPPSHCPRCRTHIAAHDNIPIFGWLLLRGRCRTCRLSISMRYPAIELLTAVLFVALYWCEIPQGWYAGIEASCVYHPLGPQGDRGSAWFSPMAMLHWRYAFHLVLVLALIVATFIDFDHMIIPDTVTLPAMAVGVLGNTLLGQVFLVPVWYQESRGYSYLDTYRFLLEQYAAPGGLPEWLAGVLSFRGVPQWTLEHPHLHGLAVSLAGLVIGGGVVWGVRAVGYWALKREAMGFGDVVLLAMVGSFIGWQPVLVVFFLAPGFALLFAVGAWLLRGHREIPYGPYLSAATVALILGWRIFWPPAEERIFALGPFLPVAALVMFVSLGVLLTISRGVKRLLGINDDFDEELPVWTAGDQLSYLAGEQTDAQQGQWRREEWRGTAAGQGAAHQRDWRGSGAGQSWQHQWQRRSPPGRPGGG